MSLLTETVAAIEPADAAAVRAAEERQGLLTKPRGSLGVLEELGSRLAGMYAVCPPPLPQPVAIAVFAGDHGVHAQGVSPWPQEVTAQMVGNFLAGGAVINALGRQVGAEVTVVDVGVAAEVAEGNRLLVSGDMGIANTTASAALVSTFTGLDVEEVTGRGTGIDDAMLAHKVAVVRRALEVNGVTADDPVAALAAVGGLEHAAVVGFLLGAAAERTPVVLDGVIACSAALVAAAIAPAARDYWVAGHRSVEPGASAALAHLGLTPLVSLDLRLGEGSGAALAVPLVQAAARVLREVATFDSAGVTDKA